MTESPYVEMQMGKKIRVKIMVLTVVDHRVLGYYTILCWIGLNDLEFDCSHATMVRRYQLCERVGMLGEK